MFRVTVAAVAVLAGVGFMAQTPTAPTGNGALEAIQPRAVESYKLGAKRSKCGVDWRTLAGVGFVESRHGYGDIGADGKPSRQVFGPVLAEGDRATGPMQWRPMYWPAYAEDADGDGTIDPHDLDDAAVASANLLCENNVRADARQALARYNKGSDWRDADAQNYATRAIEYADQLAGADPSGDTGDRVAEIGVEVEAWWEKVGESVDEGGTPGLRGAWELVDPAIKALAKSWQDGSGGRGSYAACDLGSLGLARKVERQVERIVAAFGCGTKLAGWRDPAKDSISCGRHVHRLAFDFYGPPDLLEKVALFSVEVLLDVNMVIYDGRDWTPSNGWTGYNPPPGESRHEDHVHLDFKRSTADDPASLPACLVDQ